MTRARMLRMTAFVPVAASMGVAGFGAACGAESPQQRAESKKGDQPTPVPAKRPVTLIVDNDWHKGDRRQVVDAWTQLAAKKYPHITTEVRELGSQDKILALFASDQQGDLMQLSEYVIPVFGPKGMLQDIAPTLAAQKFDTNTLYDVKEITHWEGKRLGLMTQLNYFGWVYNKSLLGEMGVKEPTANWTWDEYLETMKKLTRTADGRWGSNLSGEIYAWLWSANAVYLDAKANKAQWDSPPVRETLQWLSDLVLRHRVVPSPAEEKEKKPSFENGNLAFNTYKVPGAGLTTAIDGRFQWEVAHPPKHTKSNKGVVTVTGRPYVVTAKARQRGVLSEAVETLVTFFDKSVQDLYASGLNVNSIPILKSVATGMVGKPGIPASFKIALDTLPSAQTYEKVPGFLDFQRAWRPEWDNVLNGEATLEQATVNMTRLGQAALDQAAR